MHSRKSSRKLLFESLESRQLLTYVPGEIGTLDMAFTGNYLPPQHAYIADTDSLLTAPTTGNAATIGLNYLTSNAASFGLKASDFQRMRVTDSYTSNGITHIYLQQTFNGLPVVDARASVHIAANGQIISANSNFVPNLPHPAVNTPPQPDYSPEAILERYVSLTNSTLSQPINMESQTTSAEKRTVIISPELSAEPITMDLQYVPRPDGGVTLGWRLNLLTPDRKHWWDMTFSAESAEDGGNPIQIADWVWNASYNVFPRPVEDPLDGARAIVVDPHDADAASPFGWHDANGVVGPEWLDTRGNNVSAQHDRNGDDQDEGGTRPTSPTLDFDTPLDVTLHPFTYTDATTTNVFYWMNLAHDVTFNHGFDEISGNFQQVNYSGKGLANDRVLADTQDPFATNNAFFGTPPDGINGFSAYGLITVSFATGAPLNPPRDIGLDGTVVAHEFAHGVSNRLTGGPANANALNALQSGGMGEGWGDWLGLVMTAEATDTPDMPRPVGEWATDSVGIGIRRNPYSFDMSINPLTLGNYNGGFPSNEVHNAGEIWASALWDMTQLLVQNHGFNDNLFEQNGGLQVAMNIVLEGMKLQPANPTFMEARDAILAADFALYGGENWDAIWEAFARRGFGLNAEAGIGVNFNSNSEVVIENFDRPTPLAEIFGVVYQDVNGNARRDAVDQPLQGWTVYVDANNNAQLDVGEKNTVSGIDGSYSLSFFGSGQARIRQVVQDGFTQVQPAGGGAYVVSIPSRGQVATGLDFGNREQTGQISGFKFHDLDGDATFDEDDPTTQNINEGEPGMAGVIIYCDLNNDGRIGILEPAAMTDINGKYTIPNIQPGTNYTIRELNAAGLIQTFPDPLGPDGGAHVGVAVVRGETTADINFGNRVAIDFGDAPTAAQTGFAADYPTTLPLGARHGILAGFGLGPNPTDAEANGQPTASANGDDNAGVPDDEDGVTIPGLTPGTTVNAAVRVRHGATSAGLLQGWIDWNRDGDWDDAGEQVARNLLLREQALPHAIPISVPLGLELGPVYARFRYSHETNLGPTGPATAGEVEDYVAFVLQTNPVANNDCFGGGANGPCGPGPNIVIKQGSIDNVLDVLANDFGTVDGGPIIVTFTPFTDPVSGSIWELNQAGDRILYTPGPNVVSPETFMYKVRDNRPVAQGGPRESGFATITVHITAADPLAVDDTRTVQFSAGVQPYHVLDVLSNDFPQPPPAVTKTITAITRVTTGVVPANEDMRRINNNTQLEFRPGNGFTGTVIYKYTMDDADQLTDPSEAFVTIQVVDGVTAGNPQPAASHLASLEVRLLDPVTRTELTGNIAPGTEFLLTVVSKDNRPRPFAESGVETAYLDVLFNNNLADVILDPPHPLGFSIMFDGRPTDAPVDTAAVAATPPPSQTATEISFTGDATLDAGDFQALNIVFTSGNLAGRRTEILGYDEATKRFTVSPNAFPAAPTPGSTFRVENPFYSFAHRGEANEPAFGSINEVGGAHSNQANPGLPAGSDFNTVFSVRMRAKNNTGTAQVLNVYADPADEDVAGEDFSKVILTNRPNPAPNEFVLLTDEQVFLKADSITVLPAAPGGGGGEGEFSNLRNPLDVNDDSHVSPIDALLVINDLNANGSRGLSQLGIAATGQLPAGYLDVNFDAFVAPIDALLVINFLNQGIAPGALPEGEGEMTVAADAGEGESNDDPGAGVDEGVAALFFSAPDEPGLQQSLLSEGDEELCDLPLPQAVTTLVTGLVEQIESLASSGSEFDPESISNLVTDAVDRLFAQLACHGVLDSGFFCDEE